MISFVNFSGKTHLKIKMKNGEKEKDILERALVELYNNQNYTKFTLEDPNGKVLLKEKNGTSDLHETLDDIYPSRETFFRFSSPLSKSYAYEELKTNNNIYLSIDARKGYSDNIQQILFQNAQKRNLTVLKKLKRSKIFLVSEDFKNIYAKLSTVFYYFFEIPLRAISLAANGISLVISLPFNSLSKSNIKFSYNKIFTKKIGYKNIERRLRFKMSTDISIAKNSYDDFYEEKDYVRKFIDRNYQGENTEEIIKNIKERFEEKYQDKIIKRLNSSTAIIKKKYHHVWSKYNPFGYLDYFITTTLSAISDFSTAFLSATVTTILWIASLPLLLPSVFFRNNFSTAIDSLEEKIKIGEQSIMKQMPIMCNKAHVQILRTAATNPSASDVKNETSAPQISYCKDQSFWSELAKDPILDPAVFNEVEKFLNGTLAKV